MNWQGCKNILCIRPDNMGDLIMTAPALRALKETFNAKITILTSSMAKRVIEFIPEIDDAIIFDLPWVKTAEVPDKADFDKAVAIIKERQFDAAVIFTVYSQNPLSTAMLPYLAGIPKVLAYCRENPYHLINCWVPDKEPYDLIKHQVQRDIDLVATVGAITTNNKLHINVNEQLWLDVTEKLLECGINTYKPWLILHPGVSEKKREYPIKHWAKAAQELIKNGYQVIITGSASEKSLTVELQKLTGEGSFAAGGLFALDELICLIKNAPVMLSVNTGTVHIAAATGTPVVVLYAQTNPQHKPWGINHKVLEFPVAAHLRSRNEVIAYVNKTIYSKPTGLPTANDIVKAAMELVNLPSLPIQQFHEIPDENQEIVAS